MEYLPHQLASFGKAGLGWSMNAVRPSASVSSLQQLFLTQCSDISKRTVMAMSCVCYSVNYLRSLCVG